MNASELEEKYLPRIILKGGLFLLPWEIATNLLKDCLKCDIRFLGVEAFRIFEEGGIQPSMEFSNVCFGTAAESNGKLEFTPETRLQTPWNIDPGALEKTLDLITEGAKNGYCWYEVSLEDPETNELLFFRRLA